MKPSILVKLETLVERYEEVQHLLSDPEIIGNQDKFRALSREYSQLEEVTKCFQAYQQAKEDLETAEEMANEDDPEMREMAQEEVKEAKAEIIRLEDELQVLLIPKDPNDEPEASTIGNHEKTFSLSNGFAIPTIHFSPLACFPHADKSPEALIIPAKTFFDFIKSFALSAA